MNKALRKVVIAGNYSMNCPVCGKERNRALYRPTSGRPG